MGFFRDFWYGVTHPFDRTGLGQLSQDELEQLVEQGWLEPSPLQKLSDMWDDTFGHIVRFFPFIIVCGLLILFWYLGFLRVAKDMLNKVKV